MKRSGKFYRKNESEVMKMLGFRPTKNSGSGWIEKEDGENENLLCQLKSTDASSIKINKLDIDKLLYNSSVSHKLPVFAIQFLQTNEVFLLVKPEDISDIAKYIETGENKKVYDLGLNISDEEKPKTKRRVISSSENAREQFHIEQNKKYKKGGKSAT